MAPRPGLSFEPICDCVSDQCVNDCLLSNDAEACCFAASSQDIAFTSAPTVGNLRATSTVDAEPRRLRVALLEQRQPAEQVWTEVHVDVFDAKKVPIRRIRKSHDFRELCNLDAL